MSGSALVAGLIVELLDSCVAAAIDRIVFGRRSARRIGSLVVLLALLLATTWGLIAGRAQAALLHAASTLGRPKQVV